MSFTYTKLISSITESTIWCEDSDVRIVWITMLAMTDMHGRVFASVPGLANRAQVSLEKTELALDKFLSPDKYSRTPDNEGRRIGVIDGGWLLLNHDKYKSMRDTDDRKEYKAAWMREKRANDATKAAAATPEQDPEVVDTTVDNVDHGGPSRTYAAAAASTELKEKEKPKEKPKVAALPVDVCLDEANALGIDTELWLEYLKTRKAKKCPETPRALHTLINKIASGVEDGLDARALVEEANERGWKSVFIPDRSKPGHNPSAREIAAMSF